MSACDPKSQEHRDALAIVEHLMEYPDGASPDAQAKIAGKVGFIKGNAIDRARFNRARNHINDRKALDGSPCCGYRVHYRATRDSHLSLIDPNGKLAPHARAAMETARGDLQQQKAQKTTNRRRAEVWNTLAQHALNQGDREGHRLCIKAGLEVETVGVISDGTTAELEVWLTSL